MTGPRPFPRGGTPVPGPRQGVPHHVVTPPWPGQDGYPPPPGQVTLLHVMPWVVRLLRFPAEGLSCSAIYFRKLHENEEHLSQESCVTSAPLVPLLKSSRKRRVPILGVFTPICFSKGPRNWNKFSLCWGRGGQTRGVSLGPDLGTEMRSNDSSPAKLNGFLGLTMNTRLMKMAVFTTSMPTWWTKEIWRDLRLLSPVRECVDWLFFISSTASPSGNESTNSLISDSE